MNWLPIRSVKTDRRQLGLYLTVGTGRGCMVEEGGLESIISGLRVRKQGGGISVIEKNISNLPYLEDSSMRVAGPGAYSRHT